MSSSFDWDSVPEVDLDGRTIPPYPSTAVDGSDWKTYFAKLRREGVIGYGEKVEEEGTSTDPQKVYGDWGPVKIVRPAEEFDDPCGPLASYVKLAHQAGWELISLAHAFSFAEGLVYGSGAKEGTKRGDRDIELQWAHFRKPKARASVSYTIMNGKVYGAHTLRIYNGEQLGDTDMKKRMRE